MNTRPTLVAIASAATAGAAAMIWALAWSNSVRWLAMAALLITAPVVGRAMRPRVERLARQSPRASAWLGRAGPYLVATAVAGAAFWPVSAGVMPISRDHNDHYLATRILFDELIPSGRLFGWTERLGAGFPYGDVYATPVYLLTGLLHFVSFGLVPMAASYALGVMAAWLLCAFTIVAWTRRLIGGWLGPSISATAFLLDVGGWREGGWTYGMFYGVWPNQLAIGCFYLGVLCLVRLAERPTTRRLAIAVLLVGGSLWLHPINAIHLGLIGPIVLIVTLLGARGQHADRMTSTTWVAVALGLAAAFGLGWASRLMAAGADAELTFADAWRPLTDLGRMSLEGGPFENQLVVFGALALVGGIHTALAGGRFRALTLLMGATLVVFASMELLVLLDLGFWDHMPMLMYRRFSITLKPLWFAMGGVGAVVLMQGLRAQLGTLGAARTSPALRVVVLLALAPLVSTALRSLPSLVPAPAARALTAERAGIARELERLRADLELEKARHPEGPHRLFYSRGEDDRGPQGLVPIADAGWGFVTQRRVPAQVYRWLLRTSDLDVMRWVGVSLVLAHHPMEMDGASLVRSSKNFHLYRLDGASTRAPVLVEGNGQARVQAWGPRKRRIVLSGTDRGSELVLGLSPYGKWKARLRGRPVRLRHSNHWPGHTFTSVRHVRDGTLELTYRDTPRERWSFGLSMVLLAAGLAGLVFGPRALPGVGLLLRQERSHRLVHHVVVALVLVALVGGVAVLAWVGRRSTRAEWLAHEPRGSRVMAVLHRARPASFRAWPASPCVRAFTAPVRVGCSEEALQPTLTAAPVREGRVPSCLAFGVPDVGGAELVYKLPRGTGALKGELHEGGSRAVVLFETPQGATPPLPFPSRRFRMEVPAQATRVVVRFDNGSSTSLSPCLELVALGNPDGGAP